MCIRDRWQSEKSEIDKQRKLSEQLDALRTELERAQRRGELALASEIQYGRIPEVQRQLEAHNKKLADVQRSQQMLKEEVTEEDIAEVVSAWTGIPVSNLREGERDKLMRME